MTQFKLIQRSSNRLVTTFHIVNAKGDVCGSVSCAPQEESQLLRCWSGPTDRGNTEPATAVKSLSEAFISALRKQKVNRRAFALRGC
jgi:hypothetical protein